MTYLVALAVIAGCFILSGIGILFFGRKEIGGECHKPPETREKGCLSKEVGICPMEDQDGYLKMALTSSRISKATQHHH